MNGHEPFIHEIVKDPADLDARRIYADWLIEQGDPRGEFIQLFFQLDGKITGKRKSEIKREIKLLTREQIKRDRDLSLAMTKLRKLEYRHGFIEHATIGMSDFIKFGSDICSKIPLRSVVLTSGTKQIPNLAKCEHLKNIEAIDFHRNQFSDELFSEFPISPFVGNLKSIRVRGSEVGFESAKRLAESETLKRLREFTLSHVQRWDSDCVGLICQSENFANLEVLAIENSRFGKNAFPDHINRSKFRHSLKCLELSFCDIADKGFERIVAADQIWPPLERLVLNSCLLTDKSLELLTHKDHREKFPALTYLGLNFNLIGNRGITALANSVLLRQLTNVRMSQNEISLDGFMALGGSKHRNPKTEFYLAKNPIRGGQLSHLIKQYGDFGKFTA